jgi:hypothetical protein
MGVVNFVGTNISLKLYQNEYLRDKEGYEFEDVLSEGEFEKFREIVINAFSGNEKFVNCEIDGELKELRFGIISHSHNPEGVTVRGPLVSRFYDENNKPNRYDHDFQTKTDTDFIKTKIINDRLISLLIDKGLITEEDASKIKEVSGEEVIAAKFDYYTF